MNYSNQPRRHFQLPSLLEIFSLWFSHAAPSSPKTTQVEVTTNTSLTTKPPLKDLTSLTPLQGKIFAVHTSAFFHLFNEEKQLELAHRLASLLSPEKGSVIFGQHGANPVKGWQPLVLSKLAEDDEKNPTPGIQMFCHSPESWKQMWTKDVFGGVDSKGSERIKVDAQLIEIPRQELKHIMETAEDTRFWLMNWSITRL